MSSESPFCRVHDAPVFVGRGLIDQVGQLVRAKGRVFVITSHALRARFGERVAASFEWGAGPDARRDRAGRPIPVEWGERPARFPSGVTPDGESGGQNARRDRAGRPTRVEIITFEEGEARKTLETANEIITQLLERGAKRDSMAVVVGGGMIGDTAGFAASIFLRGIDLVHVPTTLLAQVDSSIGGKLAVNHPKGKNLIGSFYPPRAVISDTSILDTLPPRERLSGMYEALKGGVIADPSLFEMFERRVDDIDEIVRKAIQVKADIVNADAREADLRRLLNYGHTIAHGIEAALHYEGMTHGEAVAWGMIGANAIAVRRGLLSPEEASRIERVILDYGPSPLPPLDESEMLAATEHDKKNTGSARVMVFPRRVGECVVVSDVSGEEIAYGFRSAVRVSSVMS